MASPKQCFQNFDSLQQEFGCPITSSAKPLVSEEAAKAVNSDGPGDTWMQAEAQRLRNPVAELEGEVRDLQLSRQATTLEVQQEEGEDEGEHGKLLTELSTLRKACAALQEELQRERQETAAQRARAQVLREAVTKAVGGQADARAAAATMAAGADVELLRSQLYITREELHSQGLLLKTEQEELQMATEQLEAKCARIAHWKKKVRELEKCNEELMYASHLDQRAATSEQPSHGANIDLERRQAVRQLDRFKKATRKYVQDFREGVYSLLGWKVELKGEGSAMRWHLASRFHDQELVFQLRDESSKDRTFDLMATEWAEVLQQDRQIMAYLEVCDSIPGFLSAVTTELVTRQTL